MNPQARSYKNLRRVHLPKILPLDGAQDFRDPIPISERLVQVIWTDLLFDTQNLKTRDGQSLQIIHPGRWNAEGGPDFQNAQILITEKIIRGDIEIHLYTTGWNEHRHHVNPAYNQVILDVCLWDFGGPLFVHTMQSQRVPQLVLGEHLQCSLNELTELLDLDRYPFSPKRVFTRPSPLAEFSSQELSLYVESAGIFRFEQKVKRISEMITQHGTDQTAYQLLAEGLGYKHNKIAFREIAFALPLTHLLRLSSIDKKIELLLSETKRRHLRYSQVRPANHPHRRLAALAILIEAHPKIADWFSELAKEPAKLKKAPLLKHPFWSWHYHETGKPLVKPVKLLGENRWQEIVTNIILPFCSAKAKLDCDARLAQQIFEQYLNLPASQVNLASHQVAYDLAFPQPTKALHQQGLIQIYQDFDLMIPI